jgi:hypothetical protein
VKIFHNINIKKILEKWHPEAETTPIPAKSSLSTKPRPGISSTQEMRLTALLPPSVTPHAWITQLFARLQKADEDVRLLAEAREEEDAMEIDISYMRSFYDTRNKNASELF